MQPSPIAPAKDKYKVKNWKSYNASLCRRGQVSIWIEDGVLRQWREVDPLHPVVGQKTYPDAVILCCLTLGLVYGQKLRQTTGLVVSLLRMMNCPSYAVPDYTTLCRRQSCLPVELTERWQKGQKLDIAIDSTGLKVFGEGDGAARAVEGAPPRGEQAPDVAQAARGHRRRHSGDRQRDADGQRRG